MRSIRRQLGHRDVTTKTVLSRLDYCNAILVGLAASTVAPLRSPARGSTSPFNSPLPELHLLPIADDFSASSELCLLSAHKMLIGQAPEYRSNLLLTPMGVDHGGEGGIWSRGR